LDLPYGFNNRKLASADRKPLVIERASAAPIEKSFNRKGREEKRRKP
jgi:hypothetical protein